MLIGVSSSSELDVHIGFPFGVPIGVPIGVLHSMQPDSQLTTLCHGYFIRVYISKMSFLEEQLPQSSSLYHECGTNHT